MTDVPGLPSIDSALFRKVLGHFCSGIVVVTANGLQGPVALTVQSFASLSLDPPLICFMPGKQSGSWAGIREVGHFCVNILAEDQEELCRRMAAPGRDKFTGVGFSSGKSGAPVLQNCMGYIECSVENVYDGGDHEIVIGLVHELGITRETGPLLFFRGGYGRFAI